MRPPTIRSQQLRIGLFWGFLALSTALLTSCRQASPAANDDQFGLRSFMQAQKLGLLDKNGKVVVTPQFDEYAGFVDGLAAVRLHDKIGFITKSGQYAINPKYDWPETVWLIGHFSGGRLGRASLKAPQRFSDGLALISELNHEDVNKTKYGYINTAGSLMIPPQFDAAWSFSDGLAAAGPKNQNGLVTVGYIDTTGRYVIPPQFPCGQPFSDGLAAVCQNNVWGYINTRGRFVIEPQFKDAGPFIDGVALVNVQDKYGYIGKDGRFIINPQFDEAGTFTDGLARFKTGDKIGFIDRSGHTVIPPRFERVDDFHEGLASVWTGDRCSYMDKTGRVVLDLKLGWCGPFRDGVASVRETAGFPGPRSPWSYIDKTGQFVYRSGE